MKKILVFLPSLTNGDGIANFFMNYYESICKNGYRVDFFCVSHNVYSEKYIEKIKENNGKIYILPDYGKLKKYFFIKKYILKILKENKYDLFHINYVDLLAYECVKVANKEKILNILHIHNPRMKAKNLRERVNNYFNILAVKKSNYILACSKYAAKSVLKNRFYYKETKILHNKINIKKFMFNNQDRCDKRKELGIKDNEILIGIVARFTYQKNPDYIINVANKVLRQDKKYKFIWIGDGPLESDVHKKLIQLKIENDFLFITSTSEIEKYYSAMDIFFLPSLYEGFGYVLLESQASGLKVITSNKVPNEVLISKKDIKVIQIERKDSVKSCVNYILKCKKNTVENRKQKNLDMQKCIYNIDNNSSDLLNYYDSLFRE